MIETERQNIIDLEHLKLLRIGYIITGVLSCVFALFPLIYVALGVFIAVAGPPPSDAGPPPAALGILFAVIGVVVSLFLAMAGTLKLLAARAIGLRRSRALTYVAAGISCLDIPFGTLIGICTFMTLSRPSVERLYAGDPPAERPSGSVL